MNPAEAGAIELEEPDWRERFEWYCKQSKYPRWQAEEDAYEATLKDWRRFHFTWTEDRKRRPASGPDGVIGLATLKIFAPRWTFKEVPAPGMGYQHDDHCWFSSEQWRIVAIEDRMLCLERDGETKQIDLTKAKWTKYVEAATAVLEVMDERNCRENHDPAGRGSEAQAVEDPAHGPEAEG